MTDKTELAWAAGFFDGEGCTTTVNGSASIVVVQKDRRPLDRFARALGGNVGGPYGPYGKGCAMYRWQATGKRAKEVMDLLWPFLSDPKKEQYVRRST